jgi:hypothetical protein
VAEDAKSGLNYLLSFQIPPRFAEIVPEGGAGNTMSVVERALHLREEAVRSKAPFIHTWCVFDRDEHPKERYQRAFDLAKPHDDVTVIWANECFELWYLLHFCYRDTAIGRADLRRELSKPDRLNRKYDKADKDFFDLLKDKRPAAFRNAARLLKFNPSHWTNPSTNIHRLVERLMAIQEAAAAA